MNVSIFNENAADDLQMESVEDIAEHTPNLMIYSLGVSGINTTSKRGMLSDPHSLLLQQERMLMASSARCNGRI